MPSITPDQAAIEVVGGVDTHQDTHTAAVIDLVGRVLGTQQFPATSAGYTALLAWIRGFGRLLRIGVEGTGAYGAGLARRSIASCRPTGGWDTLSREIEILR